MYQSILITALIAFASEIVCAFPNGSPICIVGEAAPRNEHVRPSRNPLTGSMEAGGFIVKINDVALTADSTIELQANQDVRVVVTSEDEIKPFRGALLIVSKSGVDLSGTFSLTTADATKLKEALGCLGVPADGVNHVTNDLKTSVEAS